LSHPRLCALSIEYSYYKLANMDPDQNISRIRNADWIFNALWTSCGDETIPRCLLNIPHTFIFRDGYPIKALWTNDRGYVSRLSMENVVNLEREVSDRGLQGESNQMLRTCRRLLLDYSHINDYAHAQDNPSDPIICNVSSSTSVRGSLFSRLTSYVASHNSSPNTNRSSTPMASRRKSLFRSLTL
jgi:hypothetical protein